MRYGIFSDTHANIDALEVVLRAFEAHGVDTLVCLGDTVGYGAVPDACCDLVRKHASITVLGNHDAAVAGRMDYSYYYDAAREALDLHRSMISDANRAWLEELPYSAQGEGDVLFCHGSPVRFEDFEYIVSVDQAEACISVWERLGKVTFIGHSHLCRAFAVSQERAHEVVTESFPIRPGFRYVISVGSVGQPRDQDPRASYTIYDTDTETFEFHRIEYDVERAARRIFAMPGLSDAFGARLLAGV
ncbi:MAG: metallophosphoesterase [Deltaproteobacteria bacterium]|nr:MAG: metallophosphoesterase [Deltaproteobacteria bacterium]